VGVDPATLVNHREGGAAGPRAQKRIRVADPLVPAGVVRRDGRFSGDGADADGDEDDR
jgi:hypothetical protein